MVGQIRIGVSGWRYTPWRRHSRSLGGLHTGVGPGGQPADARQIAKEPPPARKSRDVYCYFDNTDKLHAPDNARELMAKLGLDEEMADQAISS